MGERNAVGPVPCMAQLPLCTQAPFPKVLSAKLTEDSTLAAGLLVSVLCQASPATSFGKGGFLTQTAVPDQKSPPQTGGEKGFSRLILVLILCAQYAILNCIIC